MSALNKQNLFIGLSVVIIAVIIALIVVWRPDGTSSTPVAVDVPIASTFQEKLVYDMTGTLNLEAFKAHCDARGGHFNECGSPCGPEAEVCIQMCVYTCELGPKNTPVPPVATTQIEARLSQTVTALGLSITPEALLEDSRCPIDAMCIQAGTVRVRARLATSSGVEMKDLKFAETQTVGDTTITLVEVSPSHTSTKDTIAPEDYRFIFEVKR